MEGAAVQGEAAEFEGVMKVQVLWVTGAVL